MVGAAALLLLLLSAASAQADLPLEQPGRVETLPLPARPHWVWIADPLMRRTVLVDVDDGRLLGMLPSGYGIPAALFPARRPEIYTLETHYSRGSRGERTDVLTIHGAASLAPEAEVVLPPKRATSAVPVAHAALSDDDRFAGVFNFTPATSLSIVDLEARRFVGEIATPGCSLVYPAGPRRFAMLCMDGALLAVLLDDEGGEADKRRSRPFFDPESDPVTEKAVRWGDRWLFVSFEGYVHPVDVSGEEPVFEERWSLLTQGDREASWRIGGTQHLAVHQGAGRLYSLMHQGGADTHKAPGSEIWVYELETRRRIQRIELESPGFTYLGAAIEGGPRWGWLVEWISNRIMRAVPEVGIDAIAVTQDEEPRLVTVGKFSGGIASYDALTGAFLRRAYSGNLTNFALQAPFGRGAGAP